VDAGGDAELVRQSPQPLAVDPVAHRDDVDALSGINAGGGLDEYAETLRDAVSARVHRDEVVGRSGPGWRRSVGSGSAGEANSDSSTQL